MARSVTGGNGPVPRRPAAQTETSARAHVGYRMHFDNELDHWMRRQPTDAGRRGRDNDFLGYSYCDLWTPDTLGDADVVDQLKSVQSIGAGHGSGPGPRISESSAR